MENNREGAISVFNLFNILKRKWLILLCAGILAAVIGFTYSNYFVTPQYRASAKMMVDTRVDQSATITSSQLSVAKQLAHTFAEIIKTNAVLNPVIDELGLNETHTSLSKKLAVSVIDDTQLLQLHLTYPDPDKALEIIRKITELSPQIINENKNINSGKILSIDNPVVSNSPISPNTKRTTALCFLIGFAIAYLYFFIRMLMDNKVRSAEDIQSVMDLQVLGVIPSIEKIKSK